MKSPKQRKPESFIRQPSYPGGKKAMDEFIKQELKYPEEALKNKVEGTVSVQFDLDVFGKVLEAKVVHGIGYGCDEEAIRLVKLLAFEKKKYRGLHVIFHKTIQIHFRIHEASKPVPAAQTINYSYKEAAKQKDKINYSIKIEGNNP